jgi:glycosyltransferase involved in cell wall biosynthesis
MSEKVSIITPTYRREKFLPLAHRAVVAQTYGNFEWLILDDSASPSAYMAGVQDPRIRYRHSPERLKIGRKRNDLIAAASGSIIVHFDDDDYYAPTYVERMVARVKHGFDFVKLSGWYLYATPYRALGYWDLNRIVGSYHVWSPSKPIGKGRLTRSTDARMESDYLGFGFSYIYRRHVWEHHRFGDDVHAGEDFPFALAAREAFRIDHFRELRGLCLHILHAGNTSRCFPQYSLPSFLLHLIFPAAVHDYIDA